MRSFTHSSVSQSVSQPVGQSASRSVGVSQSCNRSGTHTVCHSVGSATHAVCRYVTQTHLSLRHSHNQPLYTVCRSVTLYFRSVCHSNCVSLCRSVQSNLSLCHSHCLSVCHSYAICRFTTDALSAALPLTCYLSFYTTCITRSVTRIACRSRASQRTVSRYSLSISHTLLSSLMLPPHAILPSHSTFAPLSLTRQAISLSCTVTHTLLTTRWETQSVYMSHLDVGIGPGIGRRNSGLLSRHRGVTPGSMRHSSALSSQISHTPRIALQSPSSF